MPARKSCASRIIGERAVRAMAVSTSRSTDASVPSTISSRIGSMPVPIAVFATSPFMASPFMAAPFRRSR